MSNKPVFDVRAFYQFVPIDQPSVYREQFQQQADELDVLGYVIFSHEGINATIAGAPHNVDALVDWVERGLDISLVQRRSHVELQPFRRLHTKVREEIVQLGIRHVDPNQIVGQYVSPQQWNALLEDQDVLVIDTRNEEEVAMGTFEHAIDPQTETFKQFPQFVEQSLDPARHKKVAMFCTGGIRCEKATSWMLSLGFEEVYHLQGGILHYLETIPPEQSLWRGECFVFDHRISVDHQLKPGSYLRCYACWAILEQGDTQHEDYERGVSCHHCKPTQTPAREAALRERLKQRQLAQ